MYYLFDARRRWNPKNRNDEKPVFSLRKSYIFMVSGLPKTIKTVYTNEDAKKDGSGIGKERILGGFGLPLASIWPPLWSFWTLKPMFVSARLLEGMKEDFGSALGPPRRTQSTVRDLPDCRISFPRGWGRPVARNPRWGVDMAQGLREPAPWRPGLARCSRSKPRERRVRHEEKTSLPPGNHLQIHSEPALKFI